MGKKCPIDRQASKIYKPCTFKSKQKMETLIHVKKKWKQLKKKEETFFIKKQAVMSCLL